MYIGKNLTVPENEDEQKRKPISIPQNYAGNAFRGEEAKLIDVPCTEDNPEKVTMRQLPVCVEAPRERGRSSLKLDRLFSSDTLLILLALLLAGSEDGGELAVIILLLLLF